MNLLSPPTDSLYKFMAIGGLILFITSCLFIFKGDDSQKEIFARQEGEEQLLQKEVSILSDELSYSVKYKRLNDSINEGIGKLLDGLNETTNTKDSIYKDSLNKTIIYNLPDSIQKKTKELMLKNEELAIKRKLINTQKSNHDSYFITYLIALYGGEIIGIIGLLCWYFKIQVPLDDEQEERETQRILRVENWAEKCQSCFKTFLFHNERGLEKDGGLSKLFCSDCYADGSFVEPDLSIETATSRLQTKLKELKYKKRIIRKTTKKLKNALRWRRKQIW